VAATEEHKKTATKIANPSIQASFRSSLLAVPTSIAISIHAQTNKILKIVSSRA